MVAVPFVSVRVPVVRLVCVGLFATVALAAAAAALVFVPPPANRVVPSRVQIGIRLGIHRIGGHPEGGVLPAVGLGDGDGDYGAPRVDGRAGGAKGRTAVSGRSRTAARPPRARREQMRLR